MTLGKFIYKWNSYQEFGWIENIQIFELPKEMDVHTMRKKSLTWISLIPLSLTSMLFLSPINFFPLLLSISYISHSPNIQGQ